MDKRTHPLLQCLRMLGVYARMDLAWLLRDTRYALLAVASDTIGCIGEIGAVYLLAVRFDGVGGMNRYEVLFMLSYVVLISGLFVLVGSANNVHISRRIGRGQLDHMYLQPQPFALQLATEGFVPFTGLLKPAAGGALMVVSLRQLEIAPTWWWLLSLVGNLLISLAITVGLSYLFSTAAFYAPVAAEEISWTVLNLHTNLGQYPLSGMPRSMQIPLITLFPSGLLAWFPSMALLGRPPLDLPGCYPLILAIPLLIITQVLFRKGWNYYVQRGSNRYLPYGLRS